MQTRHLLLQLISKSFSKDTEESEPIPVEVDVVSVSDLSGSMRDCQGISNNCCSNTLQGVFQNPHCYSIPTSYVNLCSSQCGGTLFDGLNSSQNANKQLIDILFQNPIDDNMVGLSAYNTTIVSAFSSVLTNDNSSLKTKVDLWQARGGTCICCGINDAKNKLLDSSEDRPKTIIVMSDGEATIRCNSGQGDAKQDAINSACNASSEISNLIIYSIGLGGSVDQITMESLAQCGNGKYFSASEVEDLISIYETLAEQIIQNYKTINKLNYLKIVFYDNETNSISKNVDVPQPSETRNYNFDLAGDELTGPIVKVGVYPVIRTRSGKEVIGPLADSWERK